jgi:type IV fimbrial biogenesis protein FimT
MRPNTARPSTRRADTGATLIEVAIGLGIAGLLLLQALPAWADWIADTRLRVHAEALARTLTRARSEAIRTGHRVTTCKSADGRTCRAEGAWEQGWILYVDTNRNGEQDADELPLAVEGPAQHGIVIVGNRPVAEYVAFTSLGHARLVNGGLQMGTFVACIRDRAALHVVLAHSGRVRIERTDEPCG